MTTAAAAVLLLGGLSSSFALPARADDAPAPDGPGEADESPAPEETGGVEESVPAPGEPVEDDEEASTPGAPGEADEDVSAEPDEAGEVAQGEAAPGEAEPVQYVQLTDDQARLTPVASGGIDALSSQRAVGLDEVAVLSEPMQTEHFMVAGLGWDGSGEPETELEDLDIFLRVFEDEGWSEWLPICTCPDCAGLFITGGATAVQIQISGEVQDLPAGLELTLIPDSPAAPDEAMDEITEAEPAHELPAEEPVVPASAFAAAAEAEAQAEAEAAAPQARVGQQAPTATLAAPQSTGTGPAAPAIISRAGWGADEGNTSWTPVQYADLRTATLHHTAGTNSYTRAESGGIVRGIWHHHRYTNNWGDIGYNFLVDRHGQVFEGRKGTMESATGRMAVGAHASGHNTGSMGIAVMGDFTHATPPQVVFDRFVEIIAWQFHRAGIDARTTTTVGGTSGLPRIYGHSRVVSTACPGQAIRDRIPSIINAVAARVDARPPGCHDPAGTSAAHRRYVTRREVEVRFAPWDACAHGRFTLPAGTVLQATRVSATGNWLEVQTQQGLRWVERSAVDYASSGDIAAACVDPAGTGAASRQYVVRSGTLGWVSPLQRCGTGAVSMAAGTVLQATRVSATGNWLEVQTRSGPRWVARDAVDYANAAHIAAACTQPAGTRVASRQYVVQTPTTGWASPFERCGTGARSISTGTVVQATRISSTGNWLEVRTHGGPRWVRRADVAQCPDPAGTSSASRQYVVQNRTTTRVSPLASSACGPDARYWGSGTAPQSIQAGTVVQATRISASRNWLEIETRDGRRWVQRSDLAQCAAPAGTRPASRQYVVQTPTTGWVSPIASSACGPNGRFWGAGTGPRSLGVGTTLQATRVSASGQWLEVQTQAGRRWVPRADVSIR